LVDPRLPVTVPALKRLLSGWMNVDLDNMILALAVGQVSETPLEKTSLASVAVPVMG
jgi:hypothetical protein